MRYIGVKEAATKWNISERSVRNYCTNGRIPGAVLDGKTWDIPEDAVKPQRKKRTEKIETDLLSRLRMEKESGISGGIYHKIQIELTYNSNHIEGSRLTHDITWAAQESGFSSSAHLAYTCKKLTGVSITDVLK